MKRLLVACAILGLLGTSLFAAPRLKPTGKEVCTVEPNPVPHGSVVLNIKGSGFRPLTLLDIVLIEHSIPYAFVVTDDSGAFGAAVTNVLAPGEYAATIYFDGQYYYSQPNRANPPLASCKFTVE
jgi:hypothetical protein